MGFKDRVALITGGSKGLGRSLACQLSERGALTVICGRHEEDLAAAARSINRCLPIVADVSSEGDVRRMFATMKERFARLDLLVNNAAVGVYAPFLDTTGQELDLALDVNLKGAFYCAQEAARIMRDQANGCIVNILSGAAEKGFPNLSAYCASKHALSGLTKCMRAELAPAGIRVMSFSPGYMQTGFYEHLPEPFRPPADAPSSDEVAAAIITAIEGSRRSGGAREVLRKTGRRLLRR